MLTLNVSDLSAAELLDYLQHAIAPRPICLASTVDLKGNVNLSPFSFFNMFSINPPICIFSPSRRVRDNTTKHTLENLREVPEVAINLVNYNMVQQTSLSSVDFPRGVNEFQKSGLKAIPSLTIRPPRVAQSPVQLECTVKQIIPLGDIAGSGNLVLAEVNLMHIDPAVLNDQQKIDQEKMDLVARLGGDWYCRANRESLFKVAKPNRNIGIGVDALPESIRTSSILTGNNLGQLGNVEKLPDETSINQFCQQNEELQKLLLKTRNNRPNRQEGLHSMAKFFLSEDKVIEAWMVLLSDDEATK